jgi:hypothetical protein
MFFRLIHFKLNRILVNQEIIMSAADDLKQAIRVEAAPIRPGR